MSIRSSADVQVLIARQMLLQFALQDIGQLTDIEPRRPSPGSVAERR
jgi:hypothetical protein